MTRAVGLATALILSALAGSARAAEFSSPKGYRLGYPDGWEVATEQTRRTIDQWTQSKLKNIRDADLSAVDVLIFEPGGEDFSNNINVVVARGRVRADEQGERQAVAEVTGLYRDMGVRLEDVKSSRLKVNGRDAISVRWIADYWQMGVSVRQWQVYLPARGRTYIITCTARPDTFEKVEPLFARTIDSVKIDAGLLGRWQDLPGIVQWAIAGGVIGGLVGLVSFIKRRRLRVRRSPGSYDWPNPNTEARNPKQIPNDRSGN